MPGRISAALRSLLVLAVLFYGVTRASAHPAPFSYLDIVFRNGGIEGTLVIHVIDAAHDLNITPFERLMENAVAESSRLAIADLLSPRIDLRTDHRLAIQWISMEVLREDSALRLKYRIPDVPTGSLTIDTNLTPEARLIVTPPLIPTLVAMLAPTFLNTSCTGVAVPCGTAGTDGSSVIFATAAPLKNSAL